MITSNDNRNPVGSGPAKPRPFGDHWFELTATLSRDETDRLDDWISDALSELTGSLEQFSSPKSRGRVSGR